MHNTAAPSAQRAPQHSTREVTVSETVNSAFLGQIVRKITENNFKYNFVNENWLVLMILLIEFCSLGCDWWEVIIGLDNSLVPNWQQAII